VSILLSKKSIGYVLSVRRFSLSRKRTRDCFVEKYLKGRTKRSTTPCRTKSSYSSNGKRSTSTSDQRRHRGIAREGGSLPVHGLETREAVCRLEGNQRPKTSCNRRVPSGRKEEGGGGGVRNETVCLLPESPTSHQSNKGGKVTHRINGADSFPFKSHPSWRTFLRGQFPSNLALLPVGGGSFYYRNNLL